MLTPPGGAPVSFSRGWAYVDGTFEGKKFRFVNTHLEVEDLRRDPGGAGRGVPGRPGPRAGRGDRHRRLQLRRGAGPTDEPTTTYADLTASWFKDAWWVNPGDPGLTCCQNGTLSNPVPELNTRIDLVLTHGPVRAQSAHVVGADRIPGPRRSRSTPPTTPGSSPRCVCTEGSTPLDQAPTGL